VACGGATTPLAPTVVVAAAQDAPAAPTAPNGGSARWTLSGSVKDKDNETAIGGVSVKISDGFEWRTAVTDEAGVFRFDAVAHSGVRVVFWREGYRELTIEQVFPEPSVVLNVALVRECGARPAPVPLSYTVSDRTVTFTWTGVSSAIDYRLAVGQWDYVSPVFSTTTTGTSHVWTDVAPGTYYAQVQGRNDCGFGNAANHLKVIVP
jgi:hypothetical protein